MMVGSLLLVLGVSIGVSASSGYDRQEADACITISQRLSVKGGSYSETLMSGDDWHRYFNEKYGTNNVTWDSASIDDIIDMPSIITDFSPEQVADLAQKSGWSVEPLGKGSLKGIPYEQGGGLSMHAPNGSSLYIQYHPGGGHHGEMPYFKVSSGSNGTRRFFINGLEVGN